MPRQPSDADGWGRPVATRRAVILVELDRLVAKGRKQLSRMDRQLARRSKRGRLATQEELVVVQTFRDDMNRLATFRRNVLRGLIEGTYGVLPREPMARRAFPRRYRSLAATGAITGASGTRGEAPGDILRATREES